MRFNGRSVAVVGMGMGSAQKTSYLRLRPRHPPHPVSDVSTPVLDQNTPPDTEASRPCPARRQPASADDGVIRVPTGAGLAERIGVRKGARTDRRGRGCARRAGQCACRKRRAGRGWEQGLLLLFLGRSLIRLPRMADLGVSKHGG